MRAQLVAAMAAGDGDGVVECLRAGVWARERAAGGGQLTVDEIAEVLECKEARLVGAALCALAHLVDDASLPLTRVLRAVRAHERDALVVQAASRLLAEHMDSLERELPRVAEAAARWLRLHSQDGNVAFWAAHVLLYAASCEPRAVGALHGACGVDAVGVAVVQGAAATRRVEVHVRGRPWTAVVLESLFPRLRERGEAWRARG
jgi:alkylated DNA nucleotide flippase Atl1